MSLLGSIDDESDGTPVRDIGCFTKSERKRLQFRRFKKDTYQTIDQDDEESFFSNDDDDMSNSKLKRNRKESDLSDLVPLEMMNFDCTTSEPICMIQKDNTAVESCVKQRHLSNNNNSIDEGLNISNKQPSNVTKSTDRLVEAIEALRYTIQGNTESHSRTHQRGRTHRRKMSTYTGSRSQPNRDIAAITGDESLKIRKDKVAVELRIVFLKIGEIDTLKELYHADCFIQAKWREPKLDGFTSDVLGAVDLEKYWSPLLYIDNILTETKEAQWLTTMVNDLNEVTVIERRRIKGVFLETLELNDFPLDVQDLTITMTSERPDCEVDLIPDQAEMSAINIQTFVDQQEWKLHEHVEITKRIVLQEYSSTMKSHPCLSVTCRAARRPGYFYWNVFLIMFMISGLSFATFSVSPEKAEYRLRLSFTLVLTSVTFKYVITQSLPKISYLTYMDKYVLMSLAILCIVSIWHACVTLVPQSKSLAILNMRHYNSSTTNHKLLHPSTTDFTNNNNSIFNKEFREKVQSKSTFLGSLLRTMKFDKSADTTSNYQDNSDTNYEYYNDDDEDEDEDGKKRLTPEQIDFLKRIERDVLISFGALYILAHLIFIFWLYFDASKRRRIMRQKDKDYREFLQKNRQWQTNQHKRKSPPIVSSSIPLGVIDETIGSSAGEEHSLKTLDQSQSHITELDTSTATFINPPLHVVACVTATPASTSSSFCSHHPIGRDRHDNINIERSRPSRCTPKIRSEETTTFTMQFR